MYVRPSHRIAGVRSPLSALVSNGRVILYPPLSGALHTVLQEQPLLLWWSTQRGQSHR